MKRTVLLFCLLGLAFQLATAQRTLSTKSKKAAGYYREADNFWVRGQYGQATALLRQAIDKDDEFYEAYFRLAVINKAKGQTEGAEKLFQKTLSLDKDNAGAHFELGELYIQMGKYANAQIHIQQFLDLHPKNRNRIREAQKFLDNIEFALAHSKEDSAFNARPLPDVINQFAMQYFPVLTADQNQLIYTRRLGTTMDHDEDLVISERNESGEWSEPQPISGNINSRFNEGTCTISADGRILIFTSCHGRGGYGSCDLYISKKNGSEWSFPENMGPVVNSPAWDSQPSLSADGRTLYFISNRPGGIGKRDIWKSTIENKEWSKPENLGVVINTPEDEVSPFIHPNGVSLYFASNGRKGFGGFDIYVSDKGGHWGKPSNIGAPINTGEDQVSLFITADGSKGYYSHENLDDENNKGLIYEFEVPQSMSVKSKSTYIKGVVYDAKSRGPLGATIELYDLVKDQKVSVFNSDSVTGEYLAVLNEGVDYAFYVSKERYLFRSLNFKVDSLRAQTLDIPLDPISAGAKTVLNNIFFDFDSYELKPSSKTELKKIVNFLKQNPDLKIEVAGYTDDVGSENYNQGLSFKRARAVKNFLLRNGVDNTQISAKGYGSSNPVVSNDTEKGHSRNRRIEFHIIG